MSSAWLLPEHIADVLPAEARRIEELRRALLDMARSYGFELVMPPLLEHLDSLLTGSGHELDLRTFKLVDQLSGRSLGLRADTTPQVARIDAHLLNRQGVTRLCYCGPVLHTLPDGAQSTREPLQMGAEIYGHAGLEADLEIQKLALHGLQSAGIGGLVLDLADARILRGTLGDAVLNDAARSDIASALAAKDLTKLTALAAALPAASRSGLLALPSLYGDLAVLDEARCRLPASPLITAALDDLVAKGLLSEARVAESILASLGQRYGTRRLKQSMQMKGLAPALVTSTLLQARSTELERAREVWRRRFGSLPVNAAERARQMRFLAGRGFEGDVIHRVLRSQDDD